MSSRQQAGFTLVEAIVAISIFVIGVVGLTQLVLVSKSVAEEGRDTVQASNYLQEGYEATRSIRDSSWATFAVDGSYHLVAQAGQNPAWQLVGGGTETVGKFSRTVKIDPVMREDTNGDGVLSAGDKIVPTGGTLADALTKKVTVTITWTQGRRTVTRTLFGYLTRWQS